MSRVTVQCIVFYSTTGGRHYSDRLCSDRRYSDNLQSGRPSTSLARLAYGTEVTEGNGAWVGYPSGSGVPPPPEKLQRTSGQEYFAECGLRNAECRPWVFRGMWDAEKNLRNEV